MLSLSDRIRLLEADLIAIPPAFIMARELPFAIFRYDPLVPEENEWLVRGEVQKLAIRVENKTGRKVSLVSLADLFWESIRESEALDVLIALEREHGFEAAQRQVNQYLSDPDFRPLCPMLMDTASGLKDDVAYVSDSCECLCSGSLPCFVSPRAIRWQIKDSCGALLPRKVESHSELHGFEVGGSSTW